jgi:VWFA-related protein
MDYVNGKIFGSLWGMPVRRGIIAATAACLLAAGQAGAQTTATQPPDPTPRFRSSVDLVSVAAVVRDRKGRFVSDLSRDDFVVVEGGQEKRIVGFDREEDGPVRIALLFDISGSMRVGSKAVDAQQAARHVFSALRPGDKAALFSFDTRLQQVHGFTTDFLTLEAAIHQVESPFGQTSLYDAIAETARAVAEEASGAGRLPQRAAVVVLTDGVDTKSRLTPPEVSGIASSIDVPVYVVTVMSLIDDPRRLSKEMLPESMSGRLWDLARWTGGELFLATAPAHASQAARQIVDELRHQYLLAFESSTRPGWRPLEIRARHRHHIVRARSGYVVEGGRTLAPEAR